MELVLGIIAISLTVVGLATQYLLVIARLQERLARVETKIDLFWSSVARQVSETILSPGKSRADELLGRLAENRISRPEAAELEKVLSSRLAEEATTKAGDSGRMLALILMLGHLEAVSKTGKTRERK